MGYRRADRVGDQIREEISDILQRHLKDPRVGFVTITGVRVTDDLRHARVYVSVLGPEPERDRTLQGLNRAAGFIRRELGRRIRLRYLPDVVFEYDPSVEEGERLQRLFHEIREQREEGP
ncbi:MAG: 30S ribosome-binding factor RbfA [Deltaproteobacteria bacterium]|nr:30S ribosome-binding factor RbfA [Deltaproteobacteria bacterium]MBI3077962.1 30S ribosome-binding factor RbfA [Deltaproteobacteria bacterium]